MRQAAQEKMQKEAPKKTGMTFADLPKIHWKKDGPTDLSQNIDEYVYGQ